MNRIAAVAYKSFNKSTVVKENMRPHTATSAIVVGCLLSFTPHTAASQQAVSLPRLPGPITFDGPSNEPAWEAIAPLNLTMYQPIFGGDPSVRTEIRIAYDDEFIYIAGRMWDGGPRNRLISSLQRDGIGNDDVLMLLIDTFNDNESAVIFGTTPAAVRYDASISNDAQGNFGGGIIPSWNTFWDAAVEQTDEGWFAEMRIPFSSLRFQTDEQGRVVMGIKAFRHFAAASETVSFPETRTEWNQGLYRPSVYRDYTLEGLQSRRPVYITPYALVGVNRAPQLNTAGTTYDGVSDTEVEAGLDVKYGLTSNLTMDLTINTDFAQVEADDQQVNLSRFSLFFPEKRQFFLERSGIFSFTLNDFARVFHSRRIGIADDGSQVRILGGARLVGRAGGWDVGVINMQTAGDSGTGRPSFNNGVYRLRRRAFNEQSSLGAIMTTRLGDDGSHNIVYGADAVVKLHGENWLEVNAAQSVDDQISFDALNSSRVRISLNSRSSQGLGYGTWLTRSGENFNPELGFIQRSNFTRAELMFNYGMFPGEGSSLRFLQPFVYGTVYWRNDDHSVESTQLWQNWFFNFKSGAGGVLQFQRNFDDLRTGFPLSTDASVPVGRHTWYTAGLNASSPGGNRFVFSGNGLVGGYYDGTQQSIGGGARWVASPQLQLSTNYNFNRIRFADRDQEFVSHLARVRVTAAWDSHLTVSGFVQYSSAADNLSGNFRLRYHFSEGRDLYVVYNEQLDTDRPLPAIGAPRDPLSQRRTLVVKYSYTFVN